MALAPKFAGYRFLPSCAVSPSLVAPLHTVELYLDYVCPFSAKMFNTLHTSVFPSLSSLPHQKLGRKVQFIFRSQIQPWHPASTLAHEAALAVQRLSPSSFWPFSAALMRDQGAYFDEALAGETRNDTYRRLARLAFESTGGKVGEDDVLGLLRVGGGEAKNAGNAATGDLKVLVKMARLVGVHVSPTVLFDGVVADEISSSWTAEQWLEWLGKKVA